MPATDDIYLREPAPDMETAALDFRQEFFAAGEQIINGSALLDRATDYAAWLAQVQANTRADSVAPGWVQSEVYFAVRAGDGRIVGIIDLRLELNDFLRDFGHCGFSVRPTERGKGYAGRMLRLICSRAQEHGLPHLQLAAEATNTPSLRTIEHAGAVFERTFTHANQPSRVYRLPLPLFSAASIAPTAPASLIRKSGTSQNPHKMEERLSTIR